MAEEIKRGYIVKCGKSVKSWKRRWFILKQNGFAYYYTDSSATTEKGKIDVVDATSIKPYSQEIQGVEKLPASTSASKAFVIVTKDRVYTCVCETDGESKSWINALESVRGSAPYQGYPTPTYTTPQAAPVTKVPQAPPPYSPQPPPVPQQPPPYSSNTLPAGVPGYARSQTYSPGGYGQPTQFAPPPPPPPPNYYPHPPRPPTVPHSYQPQANYPPYPPQSCPPPPQPYTYAQNAPPRPQPPPNAPPMPQPPPHGQPMMYQAPRPAYPPMQPYAPRPPAPAPAVMQQNTTNVTVVTIPALQPNVVIRRR